MSDFKQQNDQDWAAIHKQLFPIAIPERAIWTDLNDIIAILNLIGKYDNSNHTFFPSGGGLDLEGAAPSTEDGCIEVDFGIIHILKPKRLMYESFNSDLEWNYFRLETDELEPTGVYESEVDSEELTEIPSVGYVSRVAWDEKRYDDEPLDKGSRLVARILKGDFVTFKKLSVYNHDSSTYDARHNKMSADEFRDYIKDQL